MSDEEEAVKREYDCHGGKMDDYIWSAKKPADFEKRTKGRRKGLKTEIIKGGCIYFSIAAILA